MDIEILSTGSHGNMNVIDENIIIDFGVKRSIIQDRLPFIDVILVSHRHGDHIALPALRLINRQRPSILSNLYVNVDTFKMIKRVDPEIAGKIEHIIDGDSVFTVTTRKDKYLIETFPLEHDVENQAFMITRLSDGHQLVHATDTSTMKHAPDRLFDTILVEGNWDEDKLLEQLESDEPSKVFRATRNLRHLSVQALARFIATHAKPTSKIYQLHLSSEYGIDARQATPERLASLLQEVY